MDRARQALLALLCLCCALVSSGLAHAAGPRDPDIQVYAKKCFDRIELKNHDDLKGPFQCNGPNSKKLLVHQHGKVKDIGECRPSGSNTCPTSMPAKCDYPAWLEMSGNNSCYGNSRIQKVPTPSNPDITAALLCRHKWTWTNDPKKYEDIAMIVHNKKNGETCWFQSPDDHVVLDGTAVPGPETPGASTFWMRPLDTARVGCVGCHDNGPFMNSRWMANSGVDLVDAGGPYKNSEPPFDAWPRPRFVDAGSNPDGDDCTQCHKIAAGGEYRVKLDPGNPAYDITIEFQSCADCVAYCKKDPFARNCLSCRGWIQRVTGRTGKGSGWSTHPKGANDWALKDAIALWMPDGTKWTHATWDKAYKKHVDHVMECCSQLGEFFETGKAVTAKDCKESVP